MENVMDYLCQDGVIDGFTLIKIFVLLIVCEMFGNIISSCLKSVG